MYAVIYRWRVAPQHEAEFQRRWHEGTKDIATHYGGGGSRLHKTNNGEWIAYARWPNKADRDDARIARLNAHRQDKGKGELVEEVWLEITDDLLIPEAELPERFR
jgi:heme-degrading monooxygenase HmoA